MLAADICKKRQKSKERIHQVPRLILDFLNENGMYSVQRAFRKLIYVDKNSFLQELRLLENVRTVSNNSYSNNLANLVGRSRAMDSSFPRIITSPPTYVPAEYPAKNLDTFVSEQAPTRTSKETPALKTSNYRDRPSVRERIAPNPERKLKSDSAVSNMRVRTSNVEVEIKDEIDTLLPRAQDEERSRERQRKASIPRRPRHVARVHYEVDHDGNVAGESKAREDSDRDHDADDFESRGQRFLQRVLREESQRAVSFKQHQKDRPGAADSENLVKHQRFDDDHVGPEVNHEIHQIIKNQRFVKAKNFKEKHRDEALPHPIPRDYVENSQAGGISSRALKERKRPKTGCFSEYCLHSDRSLAPKLNSRQHAAADGSNAMSTGPSAKIVQNRSANAKDIILANFSKRPLIIYILVRTA